MMKKDFHYYTIKLIAVAAFFFCCWFILGGLYAAYTFLRFKWMFGPALGVEGVKQFSGLIVFSGMMALAGFLGVGSSVGLYFFRRWGLFVFTFFVLLLWLFLWSTAGAVIRNWLLLLIPAAALVYLIWQRGKFLKNKASQL